MKRGLIAAAACAALLVPASPASADRFLTPASHDFGQHAMGATSAPKDFTLRVTCIMDMLGNCTGAFDPTYPNVSVTGDYSETNTCPKPTDLIPFMPGDTLGGNSCTITVRFTPTGTGVRSGVLSAGNRTSALTGRGPDPPPPPPAPTTTTKKKKKCKKKGKAAAPARKRCGKKKG